jgi:hypothetical protein
MGPEPALDREAAHPRPFACRRRQLCVPAIQESFGRDAIVGGVQCRHQLR